MEKFVSIVNVKSRVLMCVFGSNCGKTRLMTHAMHSDHMSETRRSE